MLDLDGSELMTMLFSGLDGEQEDSAVACAERAAKVRALSAWFRGEGDDDEIEEE
jgi:hypothetical protein